MKKNQLPREIWRHPVYWLACGFGSGASPYAPGTAGTLAAIPLYWLLASVLNLYGYVFTVLVLFVIGIYLCAETTRMLKVPDHGGIVWDEIVGLLVTLIAVPLVWYWVLLGFVLFRIFDIVKPWPIRTVDRHVHGGFGIMLDDLIAGIYAGIILHMVIYFSTGHFAAFTVLTGW